MRGVVIAKLLILTLWGSYLAVGLTQHTGTADQQIESRPRPATHNSRH